MNSLAHQRCFNHAAREAGARCPGCRQFYCRECITEHEDRVLCSACLKKLVQPSRKSTFAFRPFLRVFQCCLSLLVAWYFFFLIGEMLLKKTSSFHEGTLWQAHWANQE